MDALSSDLTWDQCEEWMRTLGYVDGKKVDWRRLLDEADVGTNKDVLKQRWNAGQAPELRAKIRTRLLEVETKRKERTPIGRRLLALDEWNRIGESLATKPEIIEQEIARLREIAEKARAAAETERAAHAAHARLTEAMESLRSITASPKGSRR